MISSRLHSLNDSSIISTGTYDFVCMCPYYHIAPLFCSTRESFEFYLGETRLFIIVWLVPLTFRCGYQHDLHVPQIWSLFQGGPEKESMEPVFSCEEELGTPDSCNSNCASSRGIFYIKLRNLLPRLG